MPRLDPIDPRTAEGRQRELLARVDDDLGMVPMFVRTLANSPAALAAYLGFSDSLATGELPATLREQITLAVSEANGCGYCVAAHSALGRAAGLSEEQIRDSRRAASPDPKIEAVLVFARKIVEARARVERRDLARLADAGYTDAQIAEVVANVALATFMNYFNLVAQTEVDFPTADPR